MGVLNVETFSTEKKVGKHVLRNVVYKIISGVLWGLLSSLKNMNNEIQLVKFCHIEFKQCLQNGL